jgi:Zn-dependent protease
VYVNLGFFVFNSIPIPPLDGSRVIYAIAPDFVRRGMEAIEQYGIIVIFAIVLLASSVIGQFMLTAINGIYHLLALIFGLA